MATLGVQFMQEELDLVLDAVIRVFQEHTDVNNLATNLEHVIQDQMSDDH
jgi:hypothetical protein